MLGLHDHCNSAALQTIFNQIGNRLSHPFLYLRSTRDFFHNASQFAEPCDSTVRDVGNMRNASKRQQVMFAHAGEFDVANQHDLVVTFFERHVEVAAGIKVETAKHFGIHIRHTARSVE
jgi:hypothetical protein